MAKGFNRPAGAAGQAGMLGQLQRLQQQMAEAQEKLAQTTVEATSGGGAVRVTMTGDQRCESLAIAPELLTDGDTEMLQDLVLTAVNSALERSRQLQQEMLGPLSGGLPF